MQPERAIYKATAPDYIQEFYRGKAKIPIDLTFLQGNALFSAIYVIMPKQYTILESIGFERIKRTVIAISPHF